MQNVTVFFVFFMALYALMGIQLFGRMDYHCVLPGKSFAEPLKILLICGPTEKLCRN